MDFYQYLRAYRKEQLGITQEEAANLLNVTKSTYSHYETGTRDIPIHLLPIIKKKFNIPDEMVLQMLFHSPLRSNSAEELATTTKDIQSKYKSNFLIEYGAVITETPELRDLVMLISNLDKANARKLLNSFRNQVAVYNGLLNQIKTNNHVEGANSIEEENNNSELSLQSNTIGYLSRTF